MTKLSVIIPCYNVEKYLRPCLDSVINQTLTDIEIICVNDGSTDKTLQIIEEYSRKDSRIKVISQENKGLSGARNTGLKHVTSEYCYFLDSDDYIEPNLLKNAYDVLQNTDVDYYCFGSEILTEGSNNIVQTTELIYKYLKIKFNGVQKALFDVGLNQNIHVWNKVFRTSIIKKHNIRFIEGLLYEDIFFTWYYFFLSKRIYFDPHIYHHYRIHSNSIMENVTLYKSYESAIPHMLNWHKLFIEVSKNKELFSRNYRNLLVLLKKYTRRTINMSPAEEKNKIKGLAKNYNKELNNLFIDKFGLYKFIISSQNIFWCRKGIIKDNICVLGFRLCINKAKFLSESFNIEEAA